MDNRHTTSKIGHIKKIHFTRVNRIIFDMDHAEIYIAETKKIDKLEEKYDAQFKLVFNSISGSMKPKVNITTKKGR
jgi:hypothetical protein